MQLSLVQCGAIAAGGLVALGRQGNAAPGPQGGLEPIVIDLSEDAAPEGARGLLHEAAEFLIASVSGCSGKR